MYDATLYKNQTINTDNIQSIFPSEISKIFEESSFFMRNDYFYISKTIDKPYVSKTIDNPYDNNTFVRRQVLTKEQIQEINKISEEYNSLIDKILDNI